MRLARYAFTACRYAESGLTRWWRIPRARLALRRFEPPYRINVGCGRVALVGWINLDLSPRRGVVDVVWDARHRFPVPDGSCQFIYSEHFLEHLTVPEGLAFLRDCRRILCPGGVLRVAMPSLEECVRQYCDDSWRSEPSLKKYNLTWIQTRAEMLNVAFRWWGHQWLYDRDELHRRLHEAGFSVLRDVERNQSGFAELQNLETREESRLICEASY